MAIIGAIDSLKYKLMGAALLRYMSLPRFLVVSYLDLSRKMIHQFSASKHHKVSTTSLFNVLQNHWNLFKNIWLDSIKKP